MTSDYSDPYKIGSVIRILDNRTLIVNIGNQILHDGDQVQVYEPADPITDLDGRILDYYIYIKSTLTVVQTETTYSICKSMEKAAIFSLSPLLEHSHAEYVPLNIDEKDINPLKPRDPVIHIGDPVRLA